MKKKSAVAVIVCLSVAVIIFFSLWQMERNDLSDMRELAQAGASSALELFEEYQNTGEDNCYWSAVAEFRSFEQAYGQLVDGTNKQSNYTYCDEVYGLLVLSSDSCKADIDEIISVMAILSNDVTDDNGYLRMADLRNHLQEFM